MSVYPLGKLPNTDLEALLAGYQPQDPRLIIGGQIGQDAAVLDIGDRYLVAKTDPITFATDQIGWYAANISANDVVCTGASPRWFLATLLLPEGKTTSALVEQIFTQITTACSALGATLVGGHTEITYGLERPIVVGQMLGEVAKEALVLTRNARIGDDLLLTKRIAIEGTAILATEQQAALANLYSASELARLANYLHQPGISVVPDARTALAGKGVHALHDPTEGGLATGLRELAAAAGVGLEIYADHLPFDTDCLRLSEYFGLHPLGLIASGSLLIAVDPACTTEVLQRLHLAAIDATCIGRLREPDFGLQLVGQNGSQPLPEFARDEIARLFE